MRSILLLPTRYYPSISGAEFYFQRLAEILKTKHDYKIDIITSNALDFKALWSHDGKRIEKKHKNFSSVNNLPIRRFTIDYDLKIEDKIRILKRNLSRVSLSLTESCLKDILGNGPFISAIFDTFNNNSYSDYDLIHTTFFPYLNLLYGLWIGKLLTKPVICTPFFHFSNPRYLNPNLIEILKKYNYLIACTSMEKRILSNKLDFDEKKIEVIPMGVDLKKYDKVKSSFKFREIFFKEKEKKFNMILYCGYKNFEKGSLSILRAIPMIIREIPRVYFVFIGPSTLAFNLELKKLKKKYDVRIVNLTPNNLKGYFDPKKIAAFNETDIYLMPSRSDAYGIAFLEAWASSKPVIGANIGATPEVINHKKDGILVEFNNPYEIARGVIYLLKKKHFRNRLGKNGYQKIKKNNSWDLVIEKTRKFYEKILREGI